MRFILIAPLVAFSLVSLAACSSDPSSSGATQGPGAPAPTSNAGPAAPKVTREMVRPAIEGTWTGTVVKDGVATPAKLVVKVRDTLSTKCGGGTLSDDSDLKILCIPTASLAIEAEVSIGDAVRPLSGALEVPQQAFTGSGSISLSSPDAFFSGSLDPRAGALAHQGTIRGSLSFGGNRYDATFTNAP